MYRRYRIQFQISGGFAPLKAADRQGVKLTWSSAELTTAVSAWKIGKVHCLIVASDLPDSL